MIKNLLPFLLLVLFVTSCKKEEEKTFVDNLEGEYIGVLKTFDCNLPQSELSNMSSSTIITKKSETEIDFSIDNAAGNILSFSAIVNADSTITIPEFSHDQDMFKGSASKGSKLRIVLGNDCVLFGSETATIIFDEN